MKDPWDLLMKIPEAITTTEREEIRRFYASTGKITIFKEAAERRIIPFVSESFFSIGIDANYWRGVLSKYEKRTEQIIEMLDELFGSFHKYGCVSPCVTENFGALLTTGKYMGCFCSGDVDISADYSEERKIRKVLTELGFSEVTRKKYNSVLAQDEFSCPEKYVKDFYINLVWEPVIREKAYTIDQRKMRKWLLDERKNAILYNYTNIRLLSPESMLIHCIYHISAGHYYCASPGIRLLTEIDRIIRTNDIEWDNVWKMARELKITKRIQIALITTAKVLDTPPERYSLAKPISKTVSRITDGFYQNKEGVMTIIEPLSLVDRLIIDIISDQGMFFTAMLRKIVYAIRWFLVEKSTR